MRHPEMFFFELKGGKGAAHCTVENKKKKVDKCCHPAGAFVSPTGGKDIAFVQRCHPTGASIGPKGGKDIVDEKRGTPSGHFSAPSAIKQTVR